MTQLPAAPPSESQKQTLFVVHLGLHEARALAARGALDQLADLLALLEPLPAQLADWREEHLAALVMALTRYQQKYPATSLNYLAYLAGPPLPKPFEAGEPEGYKQVWPSE